MRKELQWRLDTRAANHKRFSHESLFRDSNSKNALFTGVLMLIVRRVSFYNTGLLRLISASYLLMCLFIKVFLQQLVS
jgi:hypothetical protein